MSRGAKSLVCVKSGEAMNIEKQKEIEENSEEQMKEKHQQKSVENQRSKWTQEKAESPSNMEQASNVEKPGIRGFGGSSDSQYTTAINGMNNKEEISIVNSNPIWDSSQNQLWGSIRGLTDSLTKTNDLLQKEREYCRKLEKEILDLKLRLFKQEMRANISKYSEDSPWAENGAALKAAKRDSPSCMATNIAIEDSFGSLSSADEDTDEWSIQYTGKRKAPRKHAAQNKTTNKQPNKRTAQNFNNTFKKSGT